MTRFALSRNLLLLQQNFSNYSFHFLLAILEYLFYNSNMNALDTLIELSSQMDLEPAEDTGAQGESAKPACFTPKEKRAAFIHPAQLPNGKQVKLLKTLLSSACEKDCYYCPFRAGRDFRRATFKPQEFAELFMKLNQAKMAEGI